MELDLTGQTVTQALGRIEQAMVDCEDDTLDVRIDNEAVKLNVYNYLRKQNHRCRLSRQGAHHYVQVKTNRAKRGARKPPAETAFPTGHLSGKSADDPKPASPPKPAPSPVQAPPRLGRCLAIQCDQVGQRDTQLGVELLADIIAALPPRAFQTIVLVHRGARLLDSRFQQGRFRELLKRTGATLLVCAKSARFFGVSDQLEGLARATDLAALDLTRNDSTWL